MDTHTTPLDAIALADAPGEAADLLAALTFDAIDGAGGMTGNMLYALLNGPGALDSVRAEPASIPAVACLRPRIT